MFLIPVVPGPVVYVTSGVLVVPICEDAWGGRAAGSNCGNASAALDYSYDDAGSGSPALAASGGMISQNASLLAMEEGSGEASDNMSIFWMACLWANLLSYMLKLMAHILQQKMIGETLGSSVAVRAMVAPNSRLMKAIRLLLEKPVRRPP